MKKLLLFSMLFISNQTSKFINAAQPETSEGGKKIFKLESHEELQNKHENIMPQYSSFIKNLKTQTEQSVTEQNNLTNPLEKLTRKYSKSIEEAGQFANDHKKALTKYKINKDKFDKDDHKRQQFRYRLKWLLSGNGKEKATIALGDSLSTQERNLETQQKELIEQYKILETQQSEITTQQKKESDQNILNQKLKAADKRYDILYKLIETNFDTLENHYNILKPKIDSYSQNTSQEITNPYLAEYVKRENIHNDLVKLQNQYNDKTTIDEKETILKELEDKQKELAKTAEILDPLKEKYLLEIEKETELAIKKALQEQQDKTVKDEAKFKEEKERKEQKLKEIYKETAEGFENLRTMITKGFSGKPIDEINLLLTALNNPMASGVKYSKIDETTIVILISGDKYEIYKTGDDTFIDLTNSKGQLTKYKIEQGDGHQTISIF